MINKFEGDHRFLSNFWATKTDDKKVCKDPLHGKYPFCSCTKWNW